MRVHSTLATRVSRGLSVTFLGVVARMRRKEKELVLFSSFSSSPKELRFGDNREILLIMAEMGDSL